MKMIVNKLLWYNAWSFMNTWNLKLLVSDWQSGNDVSWILAMDQYDIIQCLNGTVQYCYLHVKSIFFVFYYILTYFY